MLEAITLAKDHRADAHIRTWQETAWQLHEHLTATKIFEAISEVEDCRINGQLVSRDVERVGINKVFPHRTGDDSLLNASLPIIPSPVGSDCNRSDFSICGVRRHR